MAFVEEDCSGTQLIILLATLKIQPRMEVGIHFLLIWLSVNCTQVWRHDGIIERLNNLFLHNGGSMRSFSGHILCIENTFHNSFYSK